MFAKKKFKIWWDKQDGLIRVKVRGDFEEKDAHEFSEALVEKWKRLPDQVCVLNDIREAGNVTLQARTILIKLNKNNKIVRQAFVGTKTFTKVIVNFIASFTGTNNVKFFDSEQAALSWLKKGIWACQKIKSSKFGGKTKQA